MAPPPLEINKLRKINAIIALYLEPGLIKSEFRGEILSDGINKKLAKKHDRLLFFVTQASNKIGRYPVFFSEFYSASDKISKNEALEHHIHAYLEDLTGLKEKLVAFLNEFKKDLKGASLSDAGKYEKLTRWVEERFGKVAQLRVPHAHRGPRHLDSSLVDSDSAQFILTQANVFPISRKGMELLREKQEKAFNKARDTWTAVASENVDILTRLINLVGSQIEKDFFKLLKIQPPDDLLNIVRQ